MRCAALCDIPECRFLKDQREMQPSSRESLQVKTR
jgi:hypothetical protein